MIRLLLVDDHQMFLDGIKNFLKDVSDIQVIGTALNGYEAMNLLLSYEDDDIIDVLLLDIEMPELDGFETAKYVKKNYPNIRILVLTMHSDKESILQMMKIGVDGYILKSQNQETLLTAIRNVYDSRTYFTLKVLQSIPLAADFKDTVKLTDRERDVLTLIGEGYSSKDIADRLFIGLETVNTHRQNLLKKLELPNSYHLVRYAIKNGLASL